MTIVLEIWGICLGVVFVLCLALCRAAKRPIPGIRHSNPIILVMDDNAGVLNTVRMGLENEGYTVLTTSDPNEGLRLFKEGCQNISLVLLDASMPEMTGHRMFENLWKIDPEVPVLLMARLYEEIAAAGELKSNVHGSLLKPFSLGDLVGKVRELVSFA